MLFDSYIFIFCFLPATLFGYFLLTKYKKYYLAISWLVLASLFFYGWWNPKYLTLLLLSITVNYAFGYTLWKRAANGLDNKLLLFSGITLNLLFIGYFKYAYFLISNYNQVAPSAIDFDPIILPLGISFFTFQKIAFLVDASRGQLKDYRFSDYCLFVTFFPQLIAGPIVQHKQIIPQFANTKQLKVTAQNFNVGITIFFIGLLKKIGLADSIAVYANASFDAAAAGVHLTLFEAWGGALAYTFQLYFDFSGYSDMAIGLAYLFGIKLPINFFSPYKAKNIIDFWRRWHITLSSFLREYLYIPLGGNRKGPYRRQINLMLTMLLGGLWHGANWTFVLWGGLHGLYLMINHTWQQLCQKISFFAVFKKPFFSYLSHILTLTVVVVAWVPFRAENIHVTKSMLSSMFSIHALSIPKSLVLKYGFLNDIASKVGFQSNGMFYNGLADWYFGMVWIIGLLMVALIMPNTVQMMRRYLVAGRENQKPTMLVRALTWKPTTFWAIMTALIVLVSIMLISEDSEFLYFQF